MYFKYAKGRININNISHTFNNGLKVCMNCGLVIDLDGEDAARLEKLMDHYKTHE